MSDHNDSASDFDGEGEQFALSVTENTIQLEEGVEVYMRTNLTHNSKSTNIDTTAAVRYFGSGGAVPKIMAASEAILASALEASFRVALAEARRRAGTPIDAQPVSEVPEEPVKLVQPLLETAIAPATGDFTDPLF